MSEWGKMSLTQGWSNRERLERILAIESRESASPIIIDILQAFEAKDL